MLNALLTPEQRKEMQQKAAITRKAKKDTADRIYKMDWQDLPKWRDLASEAGIRLPVYTKAPTTHELKRYCSLLGVNYDKYIEENFGCVGFTSYAKRVNTLISRANNEENTQYNMLAYVGWLLEYWKESQKLKEV